jgi:hypothetical protein
MAAVEENTETTLSLEEIAEAHSSLRQLMTAHWGARALHVAVSLDIFNTLERRPMPAEELAQNISTHPRSTEMLLGALCSLGFLEKEDDQYKNTALAKVFLVKDNSYCQAQLIKLYANGWDRWQRLEEVVRQGAPKTESTVFDANQVRAMSNSGMVTAPLVAKNLDLSRTRRILDVGGGPATYSIALAQGHPDLQLTILELDAAAPVTQEYVSAAGMQDRITVKVGDYLKTDFGKANDYDMVLLSNILHSHSVDVCKSLLRKAFNCLGNEGQCVVNDFLLLDDKTGPLYSSLFGLNMLLSSAQGATYSRREITDMMQGEGFIRCQYYPLEPTPYTLVIGLHP